MPTKLVPLLLAVMSACVLELEPTGDPNIDPNDDFNEGQAPRMPPSQSGMFPILETAAPGLVTTSSDGSLVMQPGAGLLAYQLLDRAIAYREDHFAIVDFEVPDCTEITSAYVRVTAYNDDDSYSRAVRFELDGTGGYLGTIGIGAHDVSGVGVLGPGQTHKWAYDLAAVSLGHTLAEGEGAGDEQSFLDVLNTPGRHQIETWVSTYAEYGPASWVSLELFLLR